MFQAAQPSMSGRFWPDLFTTVIIIVPHITTVVLAVLTYLSSRRNGRKVARIERTLNGKGDNSAELHAAIDRTE